MLGKPGPHQIGAIPDHNGEALDACVAGVHNDVLQQRLAAELNERLGTAMPEAALIRVPFPAASIKHSLTCDIPYLPGLTRFQLTLVKNGLKITGRAVAKRCAASIGTHGRQYRLGGPLWLVVAVHHQVV